MQNPAAGLYPYMAYTKFLLSNSRAYKEEQGANTNGFYLDTSLDFDKHEKDNLGWFSRYTLTNHSVPMTLIGEVQLDISSGCKGRIDRL